MCVPAVRDPIDKSFEEQRIEDYLKSYTATGRPPQPVPAEPTGERARAALGLPPLFQPYVEGPDTIKAFSVQESSSVSFTDPQTLPLGQEFKWVDIKATDNGQERARYASISCMKEYINFSHEELRHYAYLKGQKTRPEIIPLVQDPSTNSTASPTPNLAPNEQFQSITTTAAFAGHSFEELRIAFLQSGRELTSEAMVQALSQTPVPPSALPRPSLFRSTALRQF